MISTFTLEAYVCRVSLILQSTRYELDEKSGQTSEQKQEDSKLWSYLDIVYRTCRPTFMIVRRRLLSSSTLQARNKQAIAKTCLNQRIENEYLNKPFIYVDKNHQMQFVWTDKPLA